MFDEHGPKVSMKTLTCKVYMSEGNKHNLSLLEDLKNSPDEILETEIHHLIDFYWEKSYLRIVFNSLIYIVWAILLLVNLFMSVNCNAHQHATVINISIVYASLLIFREFI